MNRKAFLGLSSSLVLCGLAASCRDFPTRTSGAGSGGEPGGAGAAPDDGGTSNGGDFGPGSDSGAAAGSSMGGGPDLLETPVTTGGDAGMAPGDGGMAGADEFGGPPLVKPVEDLYGAVRLFAGADPVCGGTLLNNSWVLTPDTCVPADSTELSVAYGRNSASPDQVERVVEIVRFPANAGLVPPTRRNLALLGLERPIRVLGSVTDLYQPLERVGGFFLLAIQRCAGWDLDTPPHDSSKLRAVDLTPSTVEVNKGKTDGQPVGDWVWWSGSPRPDSDELAAPAARDVGAGCFYYANQTRFLMSMVIPMPTPVDPEKPAFEAVSLGLAEREISAWIDRTLIEEPDYLPLPAVGPAFIAWSPLGSLEVFAVTQDSGEMIWSSQQAGVWREPVSLGAPAQIALSKTLRPAGIFRRSGDVVVLAVAEDGGLWWKQREGFNDWNDWAKVAKATTPIASGLDVHEFLPWQFHLVAVDSAGDVRHAQYQDQWLNEWTVIDSNAPSGGAPALDVPQEGRLNVFWQTAAQTITQDALLDSQWYPYDLSGGATIASPPVLGHATAESFDLLVRLPKNHLGRRAYEQRWNPEWNDIGLELPPGELATSQRGRGHGDLIVTQPDGQVWHVAWPRAPRIEP